MGVSQLNSSLGDIMGPLSGATALEGRVAHSGLGHLGALSLPLTLHVLSTLGPCGPSDNFANLLQHLKFTRTVSNSADTLKQKKYDLYGLPLMSSQYCGREVFISYGTSKWR